MTRRSLTPELSVLIWLKETPGGSALLVPMIIRPRSKLGTLVQLFVLSKRTVVKRWPNPAAKPSPVLKVTVPEKRSEPDTPVLEPWNWRDPPALVVMRGPERSSKLVPPLNRKLLEPNMKIGPSHVPSPPIEEAAFTAVKRRMLLVGKTGPLANCNAGFPVAMLLLRISRVLVGSEELLVKTSVPA